MATVREFKRNEPNAGALDQWRRFTAQAPKPPYPSWRDLRSNVRAAAWPEQSQTQRAGKCGGVSSTADRFANLPKRTHRTRTTSRQNEANGIVFDVLAERSQPGERHRCRTASRIGETNPTQERSTSGGGLRRKRLNRLPVRESLRSNARAANVRLCPNS